MAADAISAARPGARRENMESYIKRLETLEALCNGFEGVESSYAVQAGREVRILVQPDKVSDDEVILLARNVAKKIENELDYPGQIKVSVIRESRATEYANKFANRKRQPAMGCRFCAYKGYGEEFIPSRVLCGRHKIRHPPPM